MKQVRIPCHLAPAAHSWGGEQPDIDVWYGGLVDGMRDASGQMYMRNRYYDPATGQFTQTDPIGIAGGLNAYGFAGGDPVTYSDPYGLSPDTVPELKQANLVGKRLMHNARMRGNRSGQVRITLEEGAVQPIPTTGIVLETVTPVNLRLEPDRENESRVVLQPGNGAVLARVPAQTDFTMLITDAQVNLGTGQFIATGKPFWNGLPLPGQARASGNLHENQWGISFCFFRCTTIAQGAPN